MDRAWKAALGAVAVLCAIFAVTVGGASAATKSSPTKSGKAGALDKSFGKGGKVTAAFRAESSGSTAPKYTLPFEFAPGHLEMAKAPGGRSSSRGRRRSFAISPTASSTRASARAGR